MEAEEGEQLRRQPLPRRAGIADGVADKGLPVTLTSPNTSHEDSDDCGAIILGDEEKRPNYDNKGARLNLIRTRTLIDDADVVVVRFGDKYRQWNAAFDAGYATARGKALVTLHPPGVSHMLKEVNATALAVCEDASQGVDVLDYVITGALPQPRASGERDRRGGALRALCASVACKLLYIMCVVRCSRLAHGC